MTDVIKTSPMEIHITFDEPTREYLRSCLYAWNIKSLFYNIINFLYYSSTTKLILSLILYKRVLSKLEGFTPT